MWQALMKVVTVCIINKSRPCQKWQHFVVFGSDGVPGKASICKRRHLFSVASVTGTEFALVYAIVLPVLKLGFWAGFRPDPDRENHKIDPPAGRRPTEEPILMFA